MKKFNEILSEAKFKIIKMEVINQNNKSLGKKPVKVEIVGGKIFQVKYDNKYYTVTGKKGTTTKTNKPSVELSTDDDSVSWSDERIWMTTDYSEMYLD